MASGPNSLPPQAYTREILTAAFNWLQSQPDSVRKTATTPDALVAIYTRAQRFGAPTLESEAPVSSQNFMSDLKNLAEGLKQFDDPRGEVGAAGTSASGAGGGAAAGAGAAARDSGAGAAAAYDSRRGYNHFAGVSSSPQPATFETASFNSPPPTYAPAVTPTAPPVFATQTNVVQPALNDRTLAMLQEVRVQLNLSSDHEAINMLVALGYKTLKNLLS